MRLPQRFRYRKHGCNGWDFGVCFPMGKRWKLQAGAGFGSFESNPWETLGHIIGDVADFRWIDNDYGWAGDMREDAKQKVALDLALRTMLKDVKFLESCEGVPPQSYVDDVCCHVKALAAEVERLRLYERAMQSMAAQMIHPKMTAEQMATMQLGE